MKDLIAEGFSGQSLLDEFKRRSSCVRPTVEQLIKQADDAAHGIGEFASYDDIFEPEDKQGG